MFFDSLVYTFFYSLSWYSVLSTSKVARKYEVFAVECALPSTGMGVVISKGCVIREVTDACPFRSQVQTADRFDT